MQPTMYKRAQVGTAMILVILIVLSVEAAFLLGHADAPVVLGVSALLLIIGIIFSTMTIAVYSDSVEWWLTFGLLRQKVQLSDIQFAASGRIALISGLGIRTDGTNWLWVVNGNDVVSLELRGGRKVSLGTPDPERLASVINELVGSKR